MNTFNAYGIEEQSNEYILICTNQLTYVKPFDKQYSESEKSIGPYCWMFRHVYVMH